MTRGRKPSKLAGKKLGKLTVLRATDKRDSGNFVVWECQCECGKTVERSTQSLSKATPRTSCGCHARDPIDISGMRFGQLTAIKVTRQDARKNYIWLCKCDCGKLVEKQGNLLPSGLCLLNCGCRRYRRKPSGTGKKLSPYYVDRRNEMIEMLDAGVTKSDIAIKYNLSRERVGQILATAGR